MDRGGVSAIHVLTACVLLILAASQSPAEESAVAFRIAESYPTLAGQLGAGEQLFIRLGYRSSGPARFWIEGFAAGERIAGAVTNVSPLYPAGEGEALVWIRYHEPARIDELRIYAAIDDWTPIASFSTAAELEWGGAMEPRPSPEWTERLNQEQQALGRRTEQQPVPWLAGLLISLGWASIVGYLVLQPLSIRQWSGWWRVAALVPLIATVPLIAQALYGLTIGSNLWPLWLLFFMPLAFLYLLVVAVARWLAVSLRRKRTAA